MKELEDSNANPTPLLRSTWTRRRPSARHHLRVDLLRFEHLGDVEPNALRGDPCQGHSMSSAIAWSARRSRGLAGTISGSVNPSS